MSLIYLFLCCVLCGILEHGEALQNINPTVQSQLSTTSNTTTIPGPKIECYTCKWTKRFHREAGDEGCGYKFGSPKSSVCEEYEQCYILTHKPVYARTNPHLMIERGCAATCGEWNNIQIYIDDLPYFTSQSCCDTDKCNGSSTNNGNLVIVSLISLLLIIYCSV